MSTYTDLHRLTPSYTIEGYPGISHYKNLILAYPKTTFLSRRTGISRDKSHVGLSRDIPVKVGIWQGVAFQMASTFSLELLAAIAGLAWPAPTPRAGPAGLARGLGGCPRSEKHRGSVLVVNAILSSDGSFKFWWLQIAQRPSHATSTAS